MVMKKNTVVKIIIALVIVIMCIPIFSDIAKSNVLKTIGYNDYEKIVSDTSNYGFGLIYIGKNDNDTKKEVKDIVKKYDSKDVSVNVYYMDVDDLSSEDLINLINISNVKDAYIFVANGEVIRMELSKLDSDKLDAYVKEYTANGVEKDIQYYKIAESASAYKKLVEAKKTITMAVFGRDNCFYCNQFKPVYNTVAEEYDLDIYYFNSLEYNEKEYQAIMDMGLKIPASCTKDGNEANLSDGFGTPLTLFTQNGKVIDCISGYTNKSGLISKLKTVGMITEDADKE